jgi:hypothetical protein
MSKLAVIKQYQYSPAAGGIFSTVLSGIGKFVTRGLGIAKKAAPAVAKAAKSPVGQAALYTGAALGAEKLLSGGGGASRGVSGSYGYRRGRGITARELRGYRKVARLLHKEGMVSKRARGRH